MKRRAFLATGVVLAACRKKSPPPPAPMNAAPPPPPPSSSTPSDPRASLDIRDWTFADDRRAVVLVPRGLVAGTKLPVLIALHGMGETTSVERGAHGWLDFYDLDRAIDRLRHAPLAPEDFQGLVTPERLGQMNGELATRGYEGLVVVCPYMPKKIGSSDLPYDVYGKWLGDVLLPRVRAETPALADAPHTGIDGVSLGGITALRIGLARPDLFGVVGALQPAVNDLDVAEGLADTMAQTLGGRPLRVITSTEDAYRFTLEGLHAKLDARKVPHEFLVTEGPHDYVWNKGPGSLEMLLWHDRAQRPH
ncbi:MAG: alpha/beta hydrolase [Polyangiales bacterium]